MVLFQRNKAGVHGGALYFETSSVWLDQNSTVNYTYNTAKNGGAVYFKNGSTMTFEGNTKVTYM